MQGVHLAGQRVGRSCVVDDVIGGGESLLTAGLRSQNGLDLFAGEVTSLHHPVDLHLARAVDDEEPVNAFALEEAAQDAGYARRVVADTHAAWVKSHGAIRKDLKGRSGTGHGIMSSPSMSELGLDDSTPVPSMA